MSKEIDKTAMEAAALVVAAKRAEEVTDDAATVTKLIGQIKKGSAKLHQQIELAAACCVVIAIRYGQVTPGRDLLAAVGPGFRSNSIKKWFMAYGPMVWTAKNKKDGVEESNLFLDKSRVEAFKADYSKNPVAFCTRLMNETFHSFDPEPEFKPLNFAERLEQLVKQAADHEKRQVKKLGRELTTEERAQINVTGLDVVKRAMAEAKLAAVESEEGQSEAA